MTSPRTDSDSRIQRGQGEPDGATVRLRIDLAYDGTPFAGFARQIDQRTVQGDLEAALEQLLGQPVRTTCAGRTDRGVHALAQVVHVDVDPTIERANRNLAAPAEFARRLDAATSRAITIWQVTAVADDFDARFSATERRYRYRIVDDVVAANPVRRHDRWRVDAPLDADIMHAAAQTLIGEHDYASFCRKAPGRTTVRRITSAQVARVAPGRIDIVMCGTAFCHQQVRAITGCLVDVGSGRQEPGWIADVLAARDRSAAARVAPPHGLTLEFVGYGEVWPATSWPSDGCTVR
ncbi:MAG: tRNA pseudouridine(38-40) synthase TruA [Nitriliruptoraceae bacterium]